MPVKEKVVYWTARTIAKRKLKRINKTKDFFKRVSDPKGTGQYAPGWSNKTLIAGVATGAGAGYLANRRKKRK